MRLTMLPFVIFFIVLISFFIVVFAQGYQLQSRAHTQYKPAEAVITRSEVVCGKGKNRTCNASIEYKYSVSGQLYTANRIAYISHQISAEAQVDQFPIGMHVTAYFDPANPGEAVLDNSAWPLTRLAGMLGPPLIIFIAIIGGGWIILRRIRRRYYPGFNR